MGSSAGGSHTPQLPASAEGGDTPHTPQTKTVHHDGTPVVHTARRPRAPHPLLEARLRTIKPYTRGPPVRSPYPRGPTARDPPRPLRSLVSTRSLARTCDTRPRSTRRQRDSSRREAALRAVAYERRDPHSRPRPRRPARTPAPPRGSVPPPARSASRPTTHTSQRWPQSDTASTPPHGRRDPLQAARGAAGAARGPSPSSARSPRPLQHGAHRAHEARPERRPRARHLGRRDPRRRDGHPRAARGPQAGAAHSGVEPLSTATTARPIAARQPRTRRFHSATLLPAVAHTDTATRHTTTTTSRRPA